jgi:Helix-turn-helix domain
MNEQRSVLIEPAEAARRLGIKSTNTLAVWRSTKRYPLPFVKIGSKVLYRVDDIEKFIESRVQTGVVDEPRPRRRRRSRARAQKS